MTTRSVDNVIDLLPPSRDEIRRDVWKRLKAVPLSLRRKAVSSMRASAVSPDFLQREQALLQRCYELEGISQLSAQSVKPAGLNSGKALLVHQDVETERFALLAQELADEAGGFVNACAPEPTEVA